MKHRTVVMDVIIEPAEKVFPMVPAGLDSTRSSSTWLKIRYAFRVTGFAKRETRNAERGTII